MKSHGGREYKLVRPPYKSEQHDMLGMVTLERNNMEERQKAGGRATGDEALAEAAGVVSHRPIRSAAKQGLRKHQDEFEEVDESLIMEPVHSDTEEEKSSSDEDEGGDGDESEKEKKRQSWPRRSRKRGRRGRES
jgi:hypothetical protein